MDEVTRYEQMKQEVLSIIHEQMEEHKKEWETVAKIVQDDVKSLKEDVRQQNREIIDIKENSVLDPAQADDISIAVRKKGVDVLGGKKSPAYKDTALRKRVYRDIYYMMKREYGLLDEKGSQLSYKKLRKRNFKGALMIIDAYKAPIDLENEIIATNEIGEEDDD